MKRSHSFIFFALPLVVALSPRRVFAMAATGFSNEAIAAHPLGQFNCVTAQGTDPSTLFFNPAGLTLLQGWQLSANDALFKIDTKRTAPDENQTRGVTDLLQAPSFFITKGINQTNFAYGIGVYAPFGLETEWSDDSFARYSATLSRLDIVMVAPSVAYRFSSRWQIGIGLNMAMADDVDLRKKVDVSQINGSPSPDGDSRETATGHGIGMNVGIRFAATEHQSFGVTYRSPVDVPLEGTLRMSGLSGPAAFIFGGSSYEAHARARITLPASVTAGYAIKPSARWTVETDAQWTDWTSIDSFHASFDEPDPVRRSILNAGIDPLHRDWRAVWSLGIGSEYKPDEKWALRSGIGYLWTAVPETSFEPALPDANRVEITAGVGRQLWPNTSLHLAYNGVFMRPREISNNVDGGRINGRYETVIHVASVGLEQKF